jgi:hypothetical protein
MNRAARFTLIAGAAASAVPTAYVGWSGARVLIAPFLVWVVSPFVLLWWLLGRTGPAASRMLRVTAVGVSTACVAAYMARIAWPPRSQGAFVFVIMPPLACIAALVAMLTAGAFRRPRA